MSESSEIVPPKEEQAIVMSADDTNSDQPSQPSNRPSFHSSSPESETVDDNINHGQAGLNEPERGDSQGVGERAQSGFRILRSDSRRSRSGSSQTFSRVSLGGALLAVDTLNDVLDQVEQSDAQTAAEPRNLDSVLLPAEEWADRFGEGPGSTARHIAIGMAIDARSRTSRTLKLVNQIGNVAALSVQSILSPLSRNRALRPLRRAFDTAVQRGEDQVNYWQNLGRTEEVHSRRVAATAINLVAEDSMDEVIDNERIQKFVQEMMAAQSLGIVDEAIEEIRERGVSSDTFFERPFRRLFNRPRREDVPGPDFDPRLVRPISKRSMPLVEDALLGYYAGFTSRTLALVIDIALILAFITMSGWLLQTIGGFLGDSSQIKSLALTDDAIQAIGAVISGLNAVTVVITYAFVFWTFTGQTLGMMLLGLRIVDKDGLQPTIGGSLLRLVGFIVSIAFLFLGFIWVLFDDKRQGWHDKLSGTFVVYAWDARPDETFLTYRMTLRG